MADGSVDDCHPRVQLKKIFTEDKSFFDNSDNIDDFSSQYVVSVEAVKNYVDHMKLLALKQEKRSSEKAQQRDAESRKTYKDCDWD